MVVELILLSEAIEAFMLYCKSKGLAPRTVETYLFALGKLQSYLRRSGVEPPIPTPQDLRSFIVYMLNRGLARTTIRVRMRSIRCFCNFLEREGLVETSPMKGVEIPKVPAVLPRVLSEEEIRSLLRAAKGSTWNAKRNFAMLLVFLDTGVRLSELIGLNLEDVSVQSRSIRVRNGKGGKERYVYMGRTLHRAMKRWLDARPFVSAESALFVTCSGNRLDRRNVARIIERIAARAGLDRVRIYPHLLRHTFATHYIQNGGDPFSLQRILGHSDIKTTMIYVNLAGVGLREAHAKASPIDRLFAGK